ncbi:MAG: hypothetical protein O2884_04995 [Chloroflexi bacterium]|nr:hypothetical protein [Chloroflexota bacterium]
METMACPRDVISARNVPSDAMSFPPTNVERYDAAGTGVGAPPPLVVGGTGVLVGVGVGVGASVGRAGRGVGVAVGFGVGVGLTTALLPGIPPARQLGAYSDERFVVMRRGAEPKVVMTQMSVFRLRVAAHAMRRPSGDQVGAESASRLLVSRLGLDLVKLGFPEPVAMTV